MLAVVAALLFAAALLPQAVALGRLPKDGIRLEALHGAIGALSPTVALYFSGDVEAVYQVNMWLETMERLDRPVLVILRENKYLDDIKATSAPVLCMPSAVDFMNFPLPSGAGRALRRERRQEHPPVAVADDQERLHRPRGQRQDRELQSVLEGLRPGVGRRRGGPATVSARAGRRPVGRDRPGRASPAGRDRGGTSATAGATFTVLYAPTWEGWTEDLHQSSLIPMGREIVRGLLGSPVSG